MKNLINPDWYRFDSVSLSAFQLIMAASLALILFGSNKCEPGQQQVQQTSRRELNANLRQAGAILAVYGSGDQHYADLYARLLDSMQQQAFFRIPLIIKRDDQLSQEELSQHPVLLLGAINTHKTIASLLPKLPFQAARDGFCFEKTCYQHPSAIFKLFWYPNPLQPKLPLFVFSGNSDAAIYQLLLNKYAAEWSGLFWSSWNYEIYHQNEIKVLGEFPDTSRQIDKRIHFEFSKAADTLLRTAHYTYLSNYPVSQLPQLAQQNETAYQELKNFIGKSALIDSPIEYRIYPNFEDKGLRRSDTQIAEADFSRHAAHVIINTSLDGSQQQIDLQLWLRKWLGKPATAMLETGLATRFALQWQKKGTAYWAEKLYLSGNLPSLPEILDSSIFTQESAIIGQLGSAVLVDFLLSEWGKDQFLQNYQQWRPDRQAIEKLEYNWQAYLQKRWPGPGGQEKTTAHAVKKTGYLKGFNFAHEGYRVYDGYGSAQATESLKALQSNGANAVAIVPYSFTRNPKQPSPLPVPRDAGSENDESIISALTQARSLGLFTLLKPQIWVTRGWTGDIKMSSADDWSRFFHYYYRWMRHYALIAEIHGIDALCIGVELPQASLQHEQAWRDIILKLRGIYHGKLTYAANWGEEFENIQFWDALDCIGLNCYYPLTTQNTPTKEDLSNGFAGILEKAKAIQTKYNKPLWFTEIGFRSVEAPWKNPHEEALGRPYNAEHQALCYEIVSQQLAKWKGQTGIFWWKWPSYLSHEGKDNTGFSPYNKKALRVVKQHFEQTK